ncbi:helix-turn-helix transcriptional regulator [Kitasatospora sp. NBC_01287]|uniref:helix-turn-helix domain-containing protein n=1 Tax=Kitasatospora sp. NBC_01287 TaxID=2903573 RepID=UPI0022576A6D|nr:helix-turn-helix transcriptional regulator [Kitasatospora sp. NBC_01287]MCX4751653.1 helix-turn-helix transcriptional regulator [Kitasatospora sp. NBC_01287]
MRPENAESDTENRCVCSAGRLRGRAVAPTLTALARLSEREREVLLLIASAYSDAEIATRLFISHRTVRAHVSAIFDKLALGSRVEAAVVGTYGLLGCAHATEALRPDGAGLPVLDLV